jgi:uncharacterized protein YggE
MKKILAMSLLTGVLLIMPSTILPAGADCNCQADRGYLSVSYSAEKEVSPDTVEFSVSVKTTDKKSMAEASSKNKEISNKIYEYFKSNINTAGGDYIKTSNYNATPIYTYKDNKRFFDRYEVTNNIIVHTKSLDKVSSLIDKSIEMGATNVNSLNFSLSNKDGVCEEMLSTAGKNVRKRANVVASSTGSTIVGVKNINTSCSLNQRRTNYAYANVRLMKASGASMDMEAAAPSTDIEAGNITIYANVDASFYVK